MLPVEPVRGVFSGARCCAGANGRDRLEANFIGSSLQSKRAPVCKIIMHSFSELADSCTTFTLSALREANNRTIDMLQTSGATNLVKTLQMIQLQKAVLAVGLFSIFEADLQTSLGCKNGFKKVKEILNSKGRAELKERFEDLYLAINALKHGRGSSYDALVAKAEQLPFRVKMPNESFFFEGDVSEVDTLIEVNDAFVQLCGNMISEVSQAIR
jgi:hypothetical protein